MTAFFLSFFFKDRVSRCSPGCPGICSIDQTDLELGDLLTSASQVLGLKACTTTGPVEDDNFKANVGYRNEAKRRAWMMEHVAKATCHGAAPSWKRNWFPSSDHLTRVWVISN